MVELYDPTKPGKYIPVQPVGHSMFRIVPWGYLEGLQIRFTNPLPNMDASNPLHFTFQFAGWDMKERYDESDISILQLVRNVG